MFLNELNEKEKVAFLNMAIHAAESNDEFTDEEKTMIEDYCREMAISSSNITKMSMDEIVAIYADSKEHIKKIILFETIGLLFADGVFDQKEQAFLSKYAAEIGVDSYVVDKQIELMKKYLAVVREIMDSMQ